MSTLMEDAADLRRRELEEGVAKAMADEIGHGDAAKCMAYARAAVRVLGEGAADTARLDWLADVDNANGSVSLPGVCVLANPDSMRAAIDMAMRMSAADKAQAARVSPCQGHAFAGEDGQ